MRPATSSRMKRERRRSDMAGGAKGTSGARALLGRRQDEEEAAVVIVRGKEVRHRAGGQIALRVDAHRLAELADAPLEHGAHVVLPVLEVEAEHVGDGAADDLLVGQAGQLARAAATADHATLLVAHEEGGVRRRVVVVEQLEQEPEAALRAAAWLVPEALLAIGRGRALTAVGADEQVRHSWDTA